MVIIISNKYKKIRINKNTTNNEHRLVMEAKLGRELLSSEIVHHKDECKGNNEPSNLELTTRKEHSRLHMLGKKLPESTREKMRNRPSIKGSNHVNAKLNEKQVVYIRCLLSNGYGIRELGRLFEIHHSVISDIKNRLIWKHVL